MGYSGPLWDPNVIVLRGNTCCLVPFVITLTMNVSLSNLVKKLIIGIKITIVYIYTSDGALRKRIGVTKLKDLYF